MASSGVHVQKAAMVKPMTILGILKLLAKEDAALTKMSEKITKRASPTNKIKIVITILSPAFIMVYIIIIIS